MATIKDVAKTAGVSISTVSHVINETRFVSDELRERVLNAMEKLNYHPNALARSLRLGETKTIGLIIPDNSNPFFAEVARTIEDIGYKNGYSVILCNSDGNLDKEAAYINMLITKQVDGIILISAGYQQEHLLELREFGIPFVVSDRDISPALADLVLVNNEQGGYDATRYLIGLGHRNIACITGPSDVTPSADRVHGYRRALTEARITIREDYIVPGDFRFRSGETAMTQLLRLDKLPTAVFACNDVMAIGALRALRNANLRIPDDISIVGFDDIPLASEITPALTTIAQPILEMATLSADLLISQIQEERTGDETRRTVLDTRLVVRDSCAPYR